MTPVFPVALAHTVAALALAAFSVCAFKLRKRSLRARESARHYRLLFEQNPQSMWVYDPASLRILDVNEAAVRQYGFARHVLLTMTLKDLRLSNPDGERADFTQLAPGQIRTVTHNTRDGRQMHVEIRADSIEFRGRPARLVLATDVTAAVSIARELERSASSRLATLQATADGIVVFDGNSHVTEWNSKLNAMLGIPSDERDPTVVHAALTETLHEARRNEPTAKQRHGSFDIIDLADGRVIERYSQPQRLGDDIIGYVWSLRDITEKRRHDDALRRQALVFGTISDAVVLCDAEGNIVDVNPVVTAILGYERDELIGQTPRLWQRASEQAFAAIGHALSTDGIWTGEYGFVSADGRTGIVESTVKALRDASGAVVNVIGVMRDVTVRRETERHRLQAQKLEAIGSLAAGIAHEINTPTQYVGDNLQFIGGGIASLTEVVQAATTLADSVRDGHQAATALAAYDAAVVAADIEYLMAELPSAAEQSSEGCRRISEIVHAMKRFSHPGTSRRSLVDINELVSNTITVSRNEWRYVAELETQFGQDMPLVPCFPGELQQVVLNLLVNAAHAIGEAHGNSGDLGRIVVRTSCEGGWMEVHVTDDGCGIPERNRVRVFDPFFTTKKVGFGTGQGLSISHDTVVRKHHGTLTFTSEVGRGTTFIIRLPMDAAAEAAA